MKKKIIGIVGPTASGKTALSLPLARQLSGHILCMDSMQVYTHMDIGTAKPTKEEQATVPHHLLDIVSPLDNFTVSQYAAWAKPLMDILPCPILVGGTGLYLQAVSQSMAFGQVGSDDAIREKYHALAEAEGNRAVHRILEQIDPQSAARLHENDLRRVIRAIEVYELTGTPLSQTRQEENSEFSVLPLAIRMERETLYQRIEKRVDTMLDMGLVEEVQRLLAEGVSPEAQSMQGIGYKELVPVLGGLVPLGKARDQIILNTKHYAKRQETWFKGESATKWLEGGQLLPSAIQAIDHFLTADENQSKE